MQIPLPTPCCRAKWHRYLPFHPLWTLLHQSLLCTSHQEEVTTLHLFWPMFLFWLSIAELLCTPSFALCDIRFRGKAGGAVLTLFLLNQTIQTCIANSSTLHSELRTCRSNCGKSWKVIRSLKLHWLSSFHTCASSGQDQSAWSTFSSCCEQRGHSGSSTTQWRCKFFIGMAFLQALHRKFRTLHGKDNFHIFFHNGLSISVLFRHKGMVDLASVLRKKYPDLTVYSPDWTEGQNRVSFTVYRLSGILCISSDSSAFKEFCSKLWSHCLVIGFMRELTVAPCISAVRGPWTVGVFEEGSHLSPYILIFFPHHQLSTLHLAG